MEFLHKLTVFFKSKKAAMYFYISHYNVTEKSLYHKKQLGEVNEPLKLCL